MPLKISFIALFLSLIFSQIAYSACHPQFAVSSEESIFGIMKAQNHNYAEFSLKGGKAQVLAFHSDFINPPRFLKSGDRGYEESYVFDVLKAFGHESLHFMRDEPSGLEAIIAIHNSTLGKGFAVGGTRMWNYENEGEALWDALRLSEGMTYKSSMAGLDLGGGKSVILAEAKTEKTEKLLKTYGAFLYLLNQVAWERDGIPRRFATGEDVGMSIEDVATIHQTGPGYVIGLPGKSGDPSILTAQGVVVGIEAAAKHAFGQRDLSGLDIHVQGLGNVGKRVVEYLSERGAKISVYDIDTRKTRCLSKQLGLTIKSSEQIVTGQCHVFVPCALGAVVNAQTVNRFNCKIIAGSANNQLEESKHGDILKDRGVLYAPDYVINAGGVISVSRELFGKEGPEGETWAIQKTEGIYDTLSEIFQKAKQENIGTHTASDRLAKEIIRNGR